MLLLLFFVFFVFFCFIIIIIFYFLLLLLKAKGPRGRSHSSICGLTVCRSQISTFPNCCTSVLPVVTTYNVQTNSCASVNSQAVVVCTTVVFVVTGVVVTGAPVVAAIRTVQSRAGIRSKIEFEYSVSEIFEYSRVLL